jgi:hypothetical protein
MVELEPGDRALRAAPTVEGANPPAIGASRRVTLRGEIVDSKCFLGAMKPGAGKTHKECATLCIRGGIPPMLATFGEDGSVTCYLLLDPAGGPLSAAALPFVADPVEVTGELDAHGDMLRLRVDVADIHRL